MRFTMAGKEYDLTQAQVRASLVGHAPEPIQQYWVEIDGVRWPVKQVLRLATGTRDFQSLTARSQLHKLQFTVGGDPRPQTAAAGGPSSASQFRIDELEALETVAASVSFTWHYIGAVVLSIDGRPHFPKVPDVPGLYRLDFGLDEQQVRILYIGESRSIRGRTSNYRNATPEKTGQLTSKRIHKSLVDHLSGAGTVELAIATSVRVDGSEADLRLTSARRFAENAAVFLAQLTAKVRALNIDADIGQ